MKDLRNDAKIALDFLRIMCDVTGSNNVESEEYQSYNSCYNRLAKFLYSPLRGYSEEDWPAMSLKELEYVKAQIEVRKETEQMAPFAREHLEVVHGRISERISLLEKLFSENGSQETPLV